MVCLKRSIIASALLGIFCSSCFAAAIEKSSLHWALNSGEIAADDCTITDDGEAYYLTAAQSESLSITADAPVRFHFVNSLSDEEKNMLVKFLKYEAHREDIPVLSNVDFVYRTPMTVIPMGAMAEIDCGHVTFKILESGVAE